MKPLAWLSLLLILGAGSAETRAHSFYSIYCCQGDQDCQPIPMRSVRATPNGYVVTLAPHEHRILAGETAPRSYLVPYTDVKESPDGAYHACILPYSKDKIRCLYVPPMGS